MSDSQIVRMVVEWASAGSCEQDEALSDEIADFAHDLLDGYDVSVSVDMGRKCW